MSTATVSRQVPTFDTHAPVLIVGAGAAGLIAALRVREAGGTCLVIERDRLPRGSTALSAGLVPAAGTRWQRDAGIADTPVAFGADIQAKAKSAADRVLVDGVVRQAGPTLEWLADAHGLVFSVIDNFSYPGHSARRMHGLASRSGADLIDALRQAAERAGIDILTQARAEVLFADANDRVCGFSLARPDGGRDSIGCAAAILACNGYGADKGLVAAHIPSLAGALYFGHPGNDGDALRWTQMLGAATRDLSGHQGHGSVATPHGILITWATMSEGGVQVNGKGARFSDESAGYSEQAAAVLAQPGGVAFSLFDARIAAVARQFEDFRAAEAAGAVVAADTVDGLAARLDIPAVALAATLADVARHKTGGVQDAFGRDFAGVPQLLPPYHGVRVTGALFHTQGGAVVDAQARVLRPDGTPLPNLLAAGGAACGVSGPSASGYLSGNGLLTAVALGSIAGQTAARLTGC